MSKPRYDWWSYVKGMIRRYPELCARQEELRKTSLSPDLSGMPHGHGKISDPVADAALRELPEINRREMEAVRKAIEETKRLDTGEERLRMIRLVFGDRTHTLEGAAIKLHRCHRTLVQWNGDFIRCVAKNSEFYEIHFLSHINRTLIYRLRRCLTWFHYRVILSIVF